MKGVYSQSTRKTDQLLLVVEKAIQSVSSREYPQKPLVGFMSLSFVHRVALQVYFHKNSDYFLETLSLHKK